MEGLASHADAVQKVKAVLFDAAKGNRKAIHYVQTNFPLVSGRGRYSERTDASRREQSKLRKQKFDANARRFNTEVAKELEKLRLTILRRISALPLKILRDRPLFLAKREAIRDRALTAAERSANPATREAALQAKALQIQGHFP